MLGYKPGNTDVSSGELELAGYKSIFEQMVADYNFEYCISSLRESAIPLLTMAGPHHLLQMTGVLSLQGIFIHPIVDRVGGGDSFAGGTICGFLDGKNFKGSTGVWRGSFRAEARSRGFQPGKPQGKWRHWQAGDGSGRVRDKQTKTDKSLRYSYQIYIPPYVMRAVPVFRRLPV